MPPLNLQSDDSDSDSVGEIAAKAPSATEKGDEKLKRKAGDEPVNGADPDDGEKDEEDEGGEEEDEGEGEGEEVYDVEEIKGHEYRKKQLVLLVKWLGYDHPSDMTWEPEESIVQNASDIVAEYYKSQGGRPQPTSASSKKSTPKPAKPAKKAQQTKSESLERPTKRRKRREELDAGDLPEGGISESDIREISTLHREENGTLKIHIDLKNGKNVAVSNDYAYRKFPQKMLQYYESKLTFHP